MKAASVKLVRCAIYTRVSTDQGLDQEFNSLDAQYEASSAYITAGRQFGDLGSFVKFPPVADDCLSGGDPVAIPGK